MTTQTERALISGTFSPSTGMSAFKNPVMDSYDKYVYWENQSGILRCELSSLKIDTVLMVYPLDKEVMNNVNTGANNGDKSFV